MNEELRRALEQAAGEEPQVDFSREVWVQGRVVRRRRHLAQTVGGLAAAGVLAGAFWLGGGMLSNPEALPGPAEPTVDDSVRTSAAVVTKVDEEATTVATETAPETTAEDTTATGTTETAGAPATQQGTTGTDRTSGEEAAPSDTAEGTTPPVVAPTSPEPPVVNPCGTPYPDPVLTVDGLPEVVRVKAAGVLGQAADCNLAGLIAMAGHDQTFLSFGVVAPEQAFSGVEGAERARAITILMTSFAPGRAAEDAPYRWPGSVESEEDWQLVVDSGLYTQDEVDLMRSSGMGYTGWRVGVDAAGSWAFMVAGD